MAADQRYCLACGQRRGEPRLPFMDAVVYMDALRRPQAGAPEAPASGQARSRISASASLIAGVATLVLAIGVGVLIGRSGEGDSAPVAAAAPQVIKIGGGGEAASSGGETEIGGGKKDGAKKGGAKAKAATGASGTSKAAEEVLKPAGDVKLPPPTTAVGEKCEKGTAGCSDGGEFNGSFFGE
jgi:hypothetical protein